MKLSRYTDEELRSLIVELRVLFHELTMLFKEERERRQKKDRT